jgi:hypothetical protein
MSGMRGGDISTLECSGALEAGSPLIVEFATSINFVEVCAGEMYFAE